MIFDGFVRVMSTCRDCGQAMQVIDCGDTVHPNCVERPTKVESLATGWLSAIRGNDDGQAVRLTQAEILELDARPPRLLDAALLYASWGWPVFPLKYRSKDPATQHGFQDATTDPDLIRQEWRGARAQFNIGVATGHLFDVIDVDPENGGAQSFVEQLAVQHYSTRKIQPCHGLVSTSSGGMHLYVEATGKGNYAGLRPGIDYRGRGGYVVAPPSTRGRPRSWSWIAAPSPNIKGGNT